MKKRLCFRRKERIGHLSLFNPKSKMMTHVFGMPAEALKDDDLMRVILSHEVTPGSKRRRSAA